MQKILVVSQANTPPQYEVNRQLEELGKDWKIISASTVVSSVPRDDGYMQAFLQYTITIVVEREERDISSLELKQIFQAVPIQRRLEEKGITSVKDLLSYTSKELSDICGFLKRDLKYIIKNLSLRHLYLKENPELRMCSELDLGIRIRKVINRMGINTLGELIQKTPDELLEQRNFGMTCLIELRTKLRELGLKLKGDE